MAYSKIILNGETLMDVTSDTVDAGNLLSGETATKNSGAKVTGNIASKSSSDLTASGATITAPAGYYASNASKAVASGTAGTPTATKGTVSNHAVNVTPSVTNTTGYITGSTKTGTAVSVSASELVSGTKSITANGTGIDVTDYASVDVSVTPSFTATLTSSGASNVCVKHNNTKYYTSGDTFSFSAGDTLVIVCMKGDSNYFNLNGATVAGGYGKKVDNYNWTMPSDNISIALTAQNGASLVDITASGIPTLITKSITQNGTYDAEDDNADGYSSVTVNVSVGSGLAYESGTWTPSADTSRGTIAFTNTHTTPPLFILLTDDTQTDAPINSNRAFSYNDHYRQVGHIVGNRYGYIGYMYATNDTGGTSSGTQILSYSSDMDNDTSGTMAKYYAKATEFYPSSNSASRYWRANRTYKWIAVWAPTT